MGWGENDRAIRLQVHCLNVDDDQSSYFILCMQFFSIHSSHSRVCDVWVIPFPNTHLPAWLYTYFLFVFLFEQ